MSTTPIRPGTTSFVLAVLLLATVAAAVSSLAAQEPQERTARVFSFESRGSQLGVTVSDLESADLVGAVSGGVRIDDVRSGTAAERAGLQPGDIVVSFDGERVRSTRQFSRLVQETPDGRVVGMDVVRDGQPRTLEVLPEPRTAFSLDGAPGMTAWRFEELEPRLREIEPRLREELRRLEPRLRELEPRLREQEPEIRQRLDEIERLLKELLERR